ncbi:hypothetical protein TWF192_009127 [Orbilia oligospora]|uniref:Uncharacterized protein n=2 Tax=Orbilia oligospora TaxID=2813651 RepID=A0A6G1MM96_ORBOL|nr:hypothetical protein TWF191_007615 [Orbilia oligospora]KAF3261195.1 hypothetical protein TWF192_009127 [Orbilia oligospora]
MLKPEHTSYTSKAPMLPYTMPNYPTHWIHHVSGNLDLVNALEVPQTRPRGPPTSNRTPWSRTTPIGSLPLPINYASRGVCYPIPTTYAPSGDYIEALGIYNVPFEENVRALGFWNTPTCDTPIRVGSGTSTSPPGSRSGNERHAPEFIIQIKKSQPVGLHIIPLAQRGMRVRPGSFRAFASFQEPNNESRYLKGGNAAPDKTTVITTAAPSMVGHYIPQKWEIDTWFTEAPWWLPEVSQQNVYRYLRDWIEMALGRQAGVQPADIWGVYREISSTIPTALKDVLEENSARAGRDLLRLYVNPVLSREKIKPPNFLEMVEWRRDQLEKGIVARKAGMTGFGIRMYRQDPIDDDGPNYDYEESEIENYNIGDLQVSDLELADEEAVRYDENQRQPIDQSQNHEPINQSENHKPIDQSESHEPIDQTDQIQSYPSAKNEVLNFMNELDSKIAEDQQRVETQRRTHPPFWRREDSDDAYEHSNDPSLLYLESEDTAVNPSHLGANPGIYDVSEDIDLKFFDPSTVAVGGRLVPEIGTMLETTGIPGVSRSDVENLEFEELGPFRRAWDEFEEEYARENADTDISTSPMKNNRGANGRNNEAPGPNEAIQIKQENMPQVNMFSSQDHNRGNPLVNLNQIINRISNSQPRLEGIQAGTPELPFGPNFIFRNSLDLSQAENPSSLRQGVLENEALLLSLPIRGRNPAGPVERKNQMLANARKEFDRRRGIYRGNSKKEEEEDDQGFLNFGNQVQKKRKSE